MIRFIEILIINACCAIGIIFEQVIMKSFSCRFIGYFGLLVEKIDVNTCIVKLKSFPQRIG